MAYGLAQVLEWKYGRVANTRQADPGDMSPNPKMVISEWRHKTIPQPSKAQLKKDFAEYEAYQATQVAEAAINAVKERKIQDEIRAMAEERLKARGELE